MLEERKDELELDIGMYRQTIEELRENISRYGENVKEADVLSISRKHSEVEQNLRDIRRGIEDETKSSRIKSE